MAFYVYILTNKPYGTLYIGQSDNLSRRLEQHHSREISGFTKRYGLGTLVWYEMHETRESACTRERHLKKWNRQWKINLIRERNLMWRDLAFELV